MRHTHTGTRWLPQVCTHQEERLACPRSLAGAAAEDKTASCVLPLYLPATPVEVTHSPELRSLLRHSVYKEPNHLLPKTWSPECWDWAQGAECSSGLGSGAECSSGLGSGGRMLLWAGLRGQSAPLAGLSKWSVPLASTKPWAPAPAPQETGGHPRTGKAGAGGSGSA